MPLAPHTVLTIPRWAKVQDCLLKVVDRPTKPMCVIPDGDKVADKIQLIVNLLDEEDIMIIGDSISCTFLKN